MGNRQIFSGYFSNGEATAFRILLSAIRTGISKRYLHHVTATQRALYSLHHVRFVVRKIKADMYLILLIALHHQCRLEFLVAFRSKSV